MTDLRLAPDLALPVDAVTEPIGIFANRGKGKSNAAHRFVEQLYHAGLPSIVLDVKGDWYGIRSSADGKGEGLPFLIFGGSHGDLPLEPDSGQKVARFLAEQRVPAIVDLSQFSKTQARRWVMEFAEELYRVNTEPLMVVVDEADVLIPQRLAAELMRLLGAMEDIAKRGRQRGLGITVISQRVADVNKSVTDLLETLFLFAVTGTRTRKAILEWIDDHGDAEQAKGVVATLSSLPPGECWVWSPGWLQLLKQITWLRIETFDSHATPKAGERRPSLKTMADIDLSSAKEAFAETIEKAKAADPRELHKKIKEQDHQIANLRKQLAARPAETVVETVTETVEVPFPVIDDSVIRRLEAIFEPVSDLSAALRDALVAAGDLRAGRFEPRLPSAGEGRGGRTSTQASSATKPTGETTRRPPPPPRPAAAERPDDTDLGDNADRKLLVAIAQYPGSSQRRVALLAGYSPKKSTVRNALSRLRTRGYIVGSADRLDATDVGLDALGEWDPLPTGAALIDHWRRELGDSADRNLFDVVLAAWPEAISQVEAAGRAGYDASKSTVRNALSRLRTKGLITGPGHSLRASDELGEAFNG